MEKISKFSKDLRLHCFRAWDNRFQEDMMPEILDETPETQISDSDMESQTGEWNGDAVSELYSISAWVYIAHLDPAQSEESLRKHFEQFGTVHAARILSGGRRRRRRFAMIGMHDFDKAKQGAAELKTPHGCFMIQRGEAIRILRAAGAPPFSGVDKGAVKELASATPVSQSLRARYPRIAFTIFVVSVIATAIVFWIAQNANPDADTASFVGVFNVAVLLSCFVIVGRRSGFASMRGLKRVCTIVALFGTPAVVVVSQLAGERPFWSVLATLLVWIFWGSKRAYVAANDNQTLSALTAGMSMMFSIISIGLLPGIHYAEDIARWAVLPFALSVRTTLLLGWLAVLASTALNRALQGDRPRVRSLRAWQFPPASDILPEDFRFTFVPQFDLANRIMRHCVFYLNLLWQPLARIIAYGIRASVEAYRIVASLLKDIPTILAVIKTTMSFGAMVGLIYFCWSASGYQGAYLRGDLHAGWLKSVTAAVLLTSAVFGLGLAALRLSDDQGTAYRKQMFAVAGAVYKSSLTAAWLLWGFALVYHATIPPLGPLIVFGTLLWWGAAVVVYATTGWIPRRSANSDAALSNFPKGTAPVGVNP
jgi:hypothetical protein